MSGIEASIEKSGAERLVYDGERLDDLQYRGLKLIQSPASFCFGTDSVLLAHFACAGLEKASRLLRLADLGAGSGFLSLILHARTGLGITAVELDPDQCSRLERSLRLNGIDGEAIRVVNADYLDPGAGLGVFGCAVCNPPYFTGKQGALSSNPAATHELTADIAGISAAAARLLKFGGKLFICFPCSRLTEAFVSLSRNGLEPKQLRLVKARAGAKPYLALIRAVRGAKSGLIVENELVIYDGEGNYTEEVERYYHGN